MTIPDNCANKHQQADLAAKSSEDDRKLQQWVAQQSPRNYAVVQATADPLKTTITGSFNMNIYNTRLTTLLVVIGTLLVSGCDSKEDAGVKTIARFKDLTPPPFSKVVSHKSDIAQEWVKRMPSVHRNIR